VRVWGGGSGAGYACVRVRVWGEWGGVCVVRVRVWGVGWGGVCVCARACLGGGGEEREGSWGGGATGQGVGRVEREAPSNNTKATQIRTDVLACWEGHVKLARWGARDAPVCWACGRVWGMYVWLGFAMCSSLLPPPFPLSPFPQYANKAP
jgi:hypothetical protein